MKKRWISVLLTLSLVAGSMFCFSFSAGATYYRDGQKIARVIGDEGIVMLKNENAALPIPAGASVAIFGEAQKLISNTFQDIWSIRGYIPYGYGSETQEGDIGAFPIDPLDALNEAEENGEIQHALSARALSKNQQMPMPNDLSASPPQRSAAAVIFLNPLSLPYSLPRI